MIATILRVLVAAALIALLLYRIPVRDVMAAMGSADREDIAAAFLLVLLAECVVAYRLVRIVRAHELLLSLRDAIAINLSTRFYALCLPGGSAVGTALRIQRLVKGSARYIDVVVSVVLDRLSTTAVMCTMGALFWILDPAGREWTSGILLPIAAIGGTVLYVLVAWRGSLPRPDMERGGGRVMRARLAPWMQRIESRLPRKFAEIRELAHPTRAPLTLTLWASAISLVVHVLATAAIWFITRAMGVDVSWIALVWIRVAALLAATIPISVAGLGLREGVYAVLLAANGMTESQAVAFSFLVFAVTVLGVALVGAIFELQTLSPKKAAAR